MVLLQITLLTYLNTSLKPILIQPEMLVIITWHYHLYQHHYINVVSRIMELYYGIVYLYILETHHLLKHSSLCYLIISIMI